MKLQSLKTFETLPIKTSYILYGGVAVASKKGDVSSTSQDSKTGDGTPKSLSLY